MPSKIVLYNANIKDGKNAIATSETRVHFIVNGKDFEVSVSEDHNALIVRSLAFPISIKPKNISTLLLQLVTE